MESRKYELATQSRKAKWCKTQVFFLKTDILEGVKGYYLWQFTYFLT